MKDSIKEKLGKLIQDICADFHKQLELSQEEQLSDVKFLMCVRAETKTHTHNQSLSNVLSFSERAHISGVDFVNTCHYAQKDPMEFLAEILKQENFDNRTIKEVENTKKFDEKFH